MCARSGDYNIGAISDLDESEDERPAASTTKKAKKSSSQYNRGRGVKECPACGGSVPIATKTCTHCDYSFSAKSLVSSLTAEDESASIRERFPFEPERVRGRTHAALWIRRCAHRNLALLAFVVVVDVRPTSRKRMER